MSQDVDPDEKIHLEIDRAAETISFRGRAVKAHWLLQQNIPNFQDWQSKLRRRLIGLQPETQIELRVRSEVHISIFKLTVV